MMDQTPRRACFVYWPGAGAALAATVLAALCTPASQHDHFQLLISCATGCRQQDDELDHLGEHVARIGHIGLQIHEELEQQGDLLDELDEDVEGTQTRLAQAQKKMNSVLQRAGLKGQICIIVFLMVTLVILVMLAFS